MRNCRTPLKSRFEIVIKVKKKSFNFGSLAIAIFIFIYVIENIRKPMGISYVGSSVDKKVLASVLSVDSQVKSLTAAVLAPLIGLSADYFGIGTSLVIVSAFMLLGAPLYLLRK